MPQLDQLVPQRVRRYTTDPDLPLRQRAYQSTLRDERLAAWLGSSLGILFSICFVTGLFSHIQQHPVSWFPVPARPAGLYRVTQGVHVATGIASMPVLIAKLWVVWPRFVSFPPFKGLALLVERISLFPLVGGGVFMVFSGIANIDYWYPWRFGFTAAHYWIAWVTMGAILAHIGAKWTVARQSVRRPSRRVALAGADPALGTDAEPAAAGFTRRHLLGAVAATSGLLVATTVGDTLRLLHRLAVLAPRDPTVGSQGRAINRSAENAGVLESARSEDYRLLVTGPTPMSFTLDQLRTLPTHTAVLPISCVEGWSYSATWTGIRVRDLMAMVGAPHDAHVRVESLETNGPYRISTLDADQASDRDTLLATHLDGQALDVEHGYPCRLIGPDRPGVLQTKWVTRLVIT